MHASGTDLRMHASGTDLRPARQENPFLAWLGEKSLSIGCMHQVGAFWASQAEKIF